MNELENCFLEYMNSISGRFRRKRHSIGSIGGTDNERLLLSHSVHPRTPSPFNDLDVSQTLKSKSMTLPSKKTNTLYDFFCKNTSPNLHTIIGVVDNSQNNVMMYTQEDEFDVTERIIPEYYINEHGIKVGTFNHNFYDSIIDSIRNMRILTKFQLKYLEGCTTEEYHAIVIEYNNVIAFLDNNHLF